MIFQQTRTELIILCQDPAYLRKYIPDLQAFSRTMRKERKIALYIAVPSAQEAEEMQIHCYIATKKLNQTIAPPDPRRDAEIDQSISPKMMIIADKIESLAVADVAGEARGAYSFGGPQVTILERYILENIRSANDRNDDR